MALKVLEKVSVFLGPGMSLKTALKVLEFDVKGPRKSLNCSIS